MKKLVYENQDQIHELNRNLAKGKQLTNELKAEFDKLPLQKIGTPGHVIKMLQDLPGLVEAMLPDGEPVKIMGVVLKPARIVELMDLDLQPLKSKIAEVQKKGFDMSAIHQFCDLAKYTKSKGFEVDPDLLAARLELFRVYAETPKALEIAKVFEQLAESASKMHAMGISEQQLRNRPIAYWVELRNGKFQPQINRYKELAN